MKKQFLWTAALLVIITGCKPSPNKTTGSKIQATILSNTPSTDWYEYNGDAARSHYSGLDQINTKNTGRLKLAWTYSSVGADSLLNGTQMQCNPIIIDGILYGVSANTQAFAIDAANGRELWKTHLADNGGTSSRGVTYFADSLGKRIFFGAGRWLYAIDAETGDLVQTFGNNGRIDLLQGITRPGADKYVVSNTPNTIFKNLLIVGTRVAESETALLGDIRAYDVHTGKLSWTFKTIPSPGEPGYTTWPDSPRLHIGGANAWAGMAIDRQRGMVFIPTGSAAFDFYGGNRKGDDLFANCLLALDAGTGKLIWYYQIVHHDIWDRDPPAPPNLLTVLHNGIKTDAVAQVTKHGYIFIFDRVTGKPLFDIAEKKFPGDGIAGEYPSATQPVPSLPAPFTRQAFTKNDFNDFVADRDSLVKLLASARTGTAFMPLGKQMTIIFPATDGGAQWGGAAVDTAGILYLPAKEIPGYTSLVTVSADAGNMALTGDRLYMNNCAACHGADRMGSHDGSYPPLDRIGKKLSVDNILQLLANGKGMMPSFAHLPDAERKEIMNYLLHINAKNNLAALKNPSSEAKLPYRHTGYNRWYDRNGYPVNTPPWGTLTAIDMNTGLRKWQVALGEYRALVDKGMPATGTDNYGGPLVTAGGIIFIAATLDEKFRAIDKTNGKIIWQTDLPAAGYASPSTYSIKGKQYIVIACGGGKLNTKSGDKYVAFCLDDGKQ